jgi:tetratricopeptide (TPR) repeat protein
VARAILAPVVLERPEDIAVALLMQDAELRIGSDGAERVLAAARARAEAEPSLLALLLLARIESDATAALALARRAVLAQPQSPWGHYAEAFCAARSGDWVASQRANARALELDPGHRAAARLEAAILARAGRNREAIVALRAWLAAVENDPHFSGEDRALARLDLIQLLVLVREDAAALDELARLPEDDGQALRRACLEAAALQGAGRPDEALAAARRGQTVDAASLLPLIQEALLQQYHRREPRAAAELWRKLIATEESRAGLGALLDSVRARIVLERGVAEDS